MEQTISKDDAKALLLMIGYNRKTDKIKEAVQKLVKIAGIPG